jgi:hypothetical protein
MCIEEIIEISKGLLTPAKDKGKDKGKIRGQVYTFDT